MSRPEIESTPERHAATPATRDRVERSFALRTGIAARDASVPAPPQIDNGDEARYHDKSGTYTKGVQQKGIGLVDLAAYGKFKNALRTGRPKDFEEIPLGGPRTLNGPQGGLAFYLGCLDSSQFSVPPAPALASEDYATELVELYWASLLRDIAFPEYASNSVAQQAAKELSSLPTYKGPRASNNQVTPDLLFRGGFPGETIGPYLSQFAVQNTSLGALPVSQKYITYQPGFDYMKDPDTFLKVQNGISTGFQNQPETPVFLHNGRGLAAYTHVDVLYQAYFIAYLVMNTLNGGNAVPLNPGNPYIASKTQNGFGTMGQPDFAATLAQAAREALNIVWYQKWYVHLRHRPESAGALVYLIQTGQGDTIEGRPSATVLNSRRYRAASQPTAATSCPKRFQRAHRRTRPIQLGTVLWRAPASLF
ncbi:MAG TPA: hypothetical protein VHU83_16115 [Bryobacteraceae bacterium]|jgi:hypothetical protein|nr:hypothetical protein [Bryobacteraceae bacterium]